jgi:hypothetical protein
VTRILPERLTAFEKRNSGDFLARSAPKNHLLFSFFRPRSEQKSPQRDSSAEVDHHKPTI